MSPHTKSALALAGLLGTTFATAQSTLGELLDAGAKKLSAQEFKSEVVGSTLTGPSRTGGQVNLEYKPDGLVSGNVQSPQGAISAVSGPGRSMTTARCVWT